MCRCLGGCSHAMSNNEERAWEEWEADAKIRVRELRSLTGMLDTAIEHRDAAAIVAAVQNADAISERLFQMRDGPERPE
jgi:hypothetical protein